MKRNKIGTDYVVGDIHGMYDELMQELDAINFNRKKDRLFSVGDLIDRGTQNTECLDLIKEPWFFAVLGNHEDLFIRGRWSKDHLYCHTRNGGHWIHDLSLEDRSKYIELCEILPLYITLQCKNGKTLGICHAQPPTRNWRDLDVLTPTDKETMVWGRTRIKQPDKATVIQNVTATVHGHTPTDDIVQVKNSFFIDTGACFGGRLTIIPVEDLVNENI